MRGMDTSNPLEAAVRLVGLSKLARECGVTHQAVRKWQAARRMPRTEWTGETKHSEAIERATGGQVKKAQLLAAWPVATAAAAEAAALAVSQQAA